MLPDMHPRRIALVMLFAVCVSAAVQLGCHAQHQPPAEADAGSTADGSLPEDASATAGSGCDAWCDYRSSERRDDGFCAVEFTTCKDMCIHARERGLAANPVETCIRDNALCFVDLMMCAE
jgi:hypothetical protein